MRPCLMSPFDVDNGGGPKYGFAEDHGVGSGVRSFSGPHRAVFFVVSVYPSKLNLEYCHHMSHGITGMVTVIDL